MRITIPPLACEALNRALERPTDVEESRVLNDTSATLQTVGNLIRREPVFLVHFDEGSGKFVTYNLPRFPKRSMNVTLKTIIEFRDEMREFREETRKTLTQHSHRLNVIEAGTAGLKADIGLLLTSVPVLNARLDDLEARVAALEERI